MPSAPVRVEDLAHPELGRRTALAVIALFAVLIVGVPTQQAIHELRAGGPVRALELIRNPPHWRDFDFRGDANPLHGFEKGLSDASVARGWVQPRVQELLSRWGHFGNSSVVLGRGGWLFYRPSIDFLTGPGLLTEEAGAGRPLAAIRQLASDCQAAGAHLVFMPVPEREQLYSSQLADLAAGAKPANADMEAFLDQVRALGVDVFDPLPILATEARQQLAFHPQDTHWMPEAMDHVAAALADHLRPVLGEPPANAWKEGSHPERNNGDLVYNLRLLPKQQLFEPESVTAAPIADEAGKPWASDPSASVLLLGDSFTNVYAQKELGWGEGAGLASHLALHLGAAVDAIAINGGGVNESRRELSARVDPLGGKKVVVWEIISRDLAAADWQVIPLHSRRSPTPSLSVASAATDRVVLVGELLTQPGLPPPSTPYANARVFLKYRVRQVLAGVYSSAEVLVQMPVMADRSPLPSLRYRIGDVQRLTLSERVPANWEGQPVVDTTQEYDLTPLWASEVEAAQ